MIPSCEISDLQDLLIPSCETSALQDLLIPSCEMSALQDLLLCIQNVQEVGDMLRQPGRRYLGRDGRNSAAATIQAAWRGVISRRKNSK
jgi:hypothetical protein